VVAVASSAAREATGSPSMVTASLSSAATTTCAGRVPPPEIVEASTLLIPSPEAAFLNLPDVAVWSVVKVSIIFIVKALVKNEAAVWEQSASF